MSHVEPEHNRQPEGSEPDEPFPMIGEQPQRDYHDVPFPEGTQPIEQAREWTPEMVADLLENGPAERGAGLEAVANAHNAALAAAKTTCDQCSRKLEEGALYEDHGDSLPRANVALVVECSDKKGFALVDDPEVARAILEAHDAERKEWQLAIEDCHRIISRKNEELAAEREQLSAVTVALTKADTALAAEKELRRQAEAVIADKWTEEKLGQFAAAIDRENEKPPPVSNEFVAEGCEQFEANEQLASEREGK